MKIPLRLAILLLLFAPLGLSSQSISNYTVSRTTGISYSSIGSTGNSVSAWRNNGTFSQDDNRSYFVPIGFDFWYNGVRYDQLSVSTNGFIDFSTSTDNGDATADDFGYNNVAFSTSAIASATRPAIAPFYDDLMATGGTSALGNCIKYQLSGTSPNRVFTMEWINMATYTNTTPDLNFQVKLYETSGRIEMVYGTMNTGTFTFSYTCGINAATMSSPPTAAQLKTQQASNSTTFNNTAQNNLVTVPASNSRIAFVSPSPAPATGALTFNSVSNSSMNLNWTNWAVNEVGYVIYYSTDGITYTFNQQTAANATSQIVSGLSPNTTYYWRIYAVTEGTISSTYLSGTQATATAGNKVSVGTGNWNFPTTWSPVGVPIATDNVTIANGHTVTINANATCNNLTVGQGTSGTLRIGTANTNAYTLTVGGNITVNSGAVFSVPTNSQATHTLNMSGKIANNGSINFASDASSLCNINFSRNGSTTISGTGAVNNYNRLTVNLGTSQANMLEVTSTIFTAPNNFLTLTNGTFKLSSSNAFTNTIFTSLTTISPTMGLWINNPNANITMDGGITLEGTLRLSNGTINIGNAANENLNSNGGDLYIDLGNFNVAGRYYSSSINNLSKFVMSDGTFTVPTMSSTSTTDAPFDIDSPGSTVTITGGTIVIQREGGAGAQNLGYTVLNTTNSSVTGGTLQIGNTSTPASQIIEINSTLPVGNLLVNSNNATAFQMLDLTVVNDITIASGTFNPNNLITYFGSDWVDNSIFIPGTGTVIFNGSGTGTIFKSGGETFNHLTAAGTGVLELLCPVTTNGNVLISSTLDVGSAVNALNVKGNWTNNGTFTGRTGTVTLNGTALQTLSGSATTNFYNLTFNNSAGINAASGIFNVTDVLQPVTGNFGIGSATFNLVSDATKTARIGIAPATSSFSGNFNIQRYIAGRSAGYSDLGAPVTATTFADWDNELLLLFTNNPPFNYPSIYSYDESIWDFVAVTSTAEAVIPGKGYEVYLDSYGTYTSFDPTTLSSVGTPSMGDVDVSSQITFVNDGWNLIANPYASSISLDDFIAASSQLGNTIMYYDENISDYNTLSTGGGEELAPHQGFWVEATGASPSAIFSESMKTTSGNTELRSTPSNQFTLRITQPSSAYRFASHTRIDFSASSENTFGTGDLKFRKVPHPAAPSVYSFANGSTQPLRINSLNNADETYEIPLTIEAPGNDLFMVQFLDRIALIDAGINCAYLYDAVENHYYNIFDSETIMLELKQGKIVGRFKLIFSRTICGDRNFDASMEVNAFRTDDAKINLSWNGEPENGAMLNIYNAAGQIILSQNNLKKNQNYTLPLDANTGLYMIEIISEGKRAVTRIY